MPETEPPELSVVVVVVSDTTRPPDTGHLEPCLAALARQAGAPSMEIIVPHLSATAGIDRLRVQFPQVHFLEIADVSGRSGSREHHDELRARGLARARGGVVALTEDYGIPAPDWAARMKGVAPDSKNHCIVKMVLLSVLSFARAFGRAP